MIAIACVLSAPVVFVRGFIEGAGQVGMTYGRPNSRRSVAYDMGRNLRDWWEQ